LAARTIVALEGTRRIALACALVGASLVSCGDAPAPQARIEAEDRDARPTRTPETPSTPPWTDAWILAETTRYLDDAAFRRDVLERSLTAPDNLYSRARLSAYGLGDRGWDALPEWIPRTRPVDDSVIATLATDDALALDGATPIWDGTRPQTMEAWVALGRRVFFDYPLRPEIFAEHGLADPAIARAAGLSATASGEWPGLVVFGDVDRSVRVGITCALCHTAVEDGVAIAGRARRSFDYGKLRLAFHRDTGAEIPADLAARMATWGPGRADITEDDDQDPVAIPDLWAIRDQTALTAAGTIRHVHPAALAIRQETQILHANRERTRPPRELAWALAMYVYALAPPERAQAAIDPAAARGRELFARHCGRCHEGASLGGAPVPADEVGTDRTLAFGRARGTGLYRPPPLVRVAEAAPYFHHGVLPSLQDLLGRERFDPQYARGAHGPGAIEGHDYGTDLESSDRGALIAYLQTL
jgi:cytochrome c5